MVYLSEGRDLTTFSRMENKPETFRIVLIGNAAVGKTSIIQRLVNKEFNSKYCETVGASFSTFSYKNPPYNVMLQIWDTAGQEKYRSLGPIYYRNSVGAIIVFDRTNHSSFESVEGWIQAFTEIAGPETLISIVGNKTDLSDFQVTTEEAQALAESRGYEYYETSAKTGDNIQQMFQSITKSLYQRRQNFKKMETSPKESESRSCSC